MTAKLQTDAQIKRIKPLDHIAAPGIIELLKDLCSAYTRHHSDLVVQGARMTGSIALSVQGHMDDHGRLVGERGNNIRALQTIFTRIGRKMSQHVLLTLQDAKVGSQDKLRPFEPDPDFKHAVTTALLTRVLRHSLKFPFALGVADVGDTTHYEIDPAPEELPIVRGDLAKSVHNLFHAIGKTRGRKIHVNLVDPQASEDAPHEPPPMAAAPPLPPPPVVALPAAVNDPVRAAREADLQREAQERGVTV